MNRRIYLLALFTLLFVACRSEPAAETTAPSEAVPTLVAEEAVEAEETAVVDTPTSTPIPTTVPEPEPPAASIPNEWTKIEPGGDTRCAHDTPFAYWVKGGSNNDLLVFFEGGGGCWNAGTCALGSGFYDPDVGSDESPERRGGVFDLDNPDNPFKDHSIVFIPSCTGDVHWGTTLTEYTTDDGETMPIYHHGFINGRSALDWTFANITNPDSIFVTGCSAGSVGSIVAAPYLIENYPNTPVTQLGDSLSFVFPGPVDLQSIWDIAGAYPDWIPTVAALDPTNHVTADYYNAIASHYPNYTFAQYNTERDNVQVRYYSPEPDPDGLAAAIATSLTTIHSQSPNFRSYTASGDLHCIMPRHQFYSMETNGVLLRDWVSDLATGQSVDSVKCEECQHQTELTAGATSAVTLAEINGRWESVSTMPTPRSENRGVVLDDNRFYIPGGWGGESTFEAYDPSTNSWETLADLPDGRHHFMVEGYDGKLYLFGGSPANAYRPTDTAWVYDPETNSWADTAPLPASRMGGVAVVLGAFIYIVGGETDEAAPGLLRYDPANDSWATLAAMNEHREHLTAVSLNNQIYAIGGWWKRNGESNAMEIYDPVSDSWQDAPPMTIQRGGLQAAVLGGKIFVAGGEVLQNGRGTENRVEVFDPETQAWQMGPPLPLPIHGFPLLSFNNTLWVIGGSDQAGASVNRGEVLRYQVGE
ncbi:MAG: pectin acetylesterase-family hydrolase [Chloroflexota bacterium]